MKAEKNAEKESWYEMVDLDLELLLLLPLLLLFYVEDLQRLTFLMA